VTQSGITFKITPDRITELPQDKVFVFGSNLAGIHNSGAALWTISQKISRHGQGVGMCFTEQGHSYALATRDYECRLLSLQAIDLQVELFLLSAKLLPEYEFLVTRIGCGPASYLPHQIAPSFFSNNDLDATAFAQKYPNIHLPQEFWDNHLAPSTC